MKLGAQLFGLLEHTRTNPDRLYATLKGSGYTDVEACVYLDGPRGQIPFWDMAELAQQVPLLRARGLTLSSCHIVSRDWAAAMPTLERLVTDYGVRQFVLGCPSPVDLETYAAYAETCMQLARQLAKRGATLLLHNSHAEILTKLEGRTAYEWLLDRCQGLLGAQPDLGWLLYGGVDPRAFLERNRARVVSIHYKDVRGDATQYDAQSANVCLGDGALDLLACNRFAARYQIPQIIDQDTSETDILQDLALSQKRLRAAAYSRDHMISLLHTLDIETGQCRTLRTFPGIIEAPNWLNDGDTLLYNADGRIYLYHISSDTVEELPTGDCIQCNNDHVPSPDNRWLAVSNAAPEDGLSRIYILPLSGGDSRLVTPLPHSYLHGWSKDGQELAYCAFRKGGASICTIPVAGGEERCIAQGEGFNDGPEYAPGDQHIWFNSTRSGLMQIWRMDRDGSNPRRMTHANANHWFPHVSPDGEKLVFLSYPEGSLEPWEHMPNLPVSLWCMDYDGGNLRQLTTLYGGQGTINVNSWSPDSRQIAFVSYEEAN